MKKAIIHIQILIVSILMMSQETLNIAITLIKSNK